MYGRKEERRSHRYSPNRGRTVAEYCRKYIVPHWRVRRRAWRPSWESSLALRRSRRRPGSSGGQRGSCCRGYCPLRSPWQCFEGPAGGDLDLVMVRTAPEGRTHTVRGFLQRGKYKGSTGSWQHSGWSSAEHISHCVAGSHSGATASEMAEQ